MWTFWCILAFFKSNNIVSKDDLLKWVSLDHSSMREIGGLLHEWRESCSLAPSVYSGMVYNSPAHLLPCCFAFSLAILVPSTLMKHLGARASTDICFSSFSWAERALLNTWNSFHFIELTWTLSARWRTYPLGYFHIEETTLMCDSFVFLRRI